MATKLPDNETPHPFDTIAQQIEDETDKVIQLILGRKKCLLIELSNHRFDYDNLVASKSENEKQLLNLKQHTENLTTNELKEMQEKMLSVIEDKLNKLTLSVTSYKVVFQINTNRIEKEIETMGRIVAFKPPKYSEMTAPVLAVGEKGKEKNELNAPRGVAFEDESELIFVCDNFNSCVKIFNSTGEVLKDFGSNKLFRPWGILLHKSHIFVTDLEKCSLLKYQRSDFKFLQSVGQKGSDSGDFNSPCQLAVGPNGRLYVPENENNRISVLNTDLEFLRHFKHEKIINPVDVKFIEEEMFVLNFKSTKIVNSFNFDGELIKSISYTVKVAAYFFTIDCIGNILISDFIGHSVVVFNKDGEQLCTIGNEGNKKGELYFPYGICTTRNGKLIVASNNMNYGLQIF